jgi:Na+-translocating ferredoxin:NAD+ oxidoreductase RnfA subunit
MKEKRLGTVFFNGILPENPVFRLVLGTCPTLAVSTSGMNGLGMGAAVIFVLTCSNIFISLLHNLIPTSAYSTYSGHLYVRDDRHLFMHRIFPISIRLVYSYRTSW